MDTPLIPRHPGKPRQQPQRKPKAVALRVDRNGRPSRAGIKADALPRAYDTPARLLREINEGRLDPKTLDPESRKACLVLLANGRQTCAELAELFGVGPKVIREQVKEIRAEVGRQVREWGLDEVVGDLAMTAEKVAAMAMRNEDYALVWSVKRDLARTLKELGVVGPKDENEGLVKLTIEAMPQAFERAKGILMQSLDPRLTGEVVREPEQVEVRPVPALPGPRRVPVPPRGKGEADPAEVAQDPGGGGPS